MTMRHETTLKLPGHTEEFQSSLVSHLFNKATCSENNGRSVFYHSLPHAAFIVASKCRTRHHCSRMNNMTDANEPQWKIAPHARPACMEKLSQSTSLPFDSIAYHWLISKSGTPMAASWWKWASPRLGGDHAQPCLLNDLFLLNRASKKIFISNVTSC